MIYLLRNPVQHYAWGSITAIPDFLGVEPDGTPQAEMWVGAHPHAPSRVVDDGHESLRALIADDPTGMLGNEVGRRWGELPFLMKYLAAAAPLSIQAHPSAEQAARGFDAEEAYGIDRDAPTRTYRDPHAKPELLAVTAPTTALCGFRAPEGTARLFDALGIDGLQPAADMLGADRPEDALRDVLTTFVELDPGATDALVAEVAEVCAAYAGDEFAAECECLADLAHRYPGDLGVLVASMLNLVRLDAGRALFLPARTLHAYIGGVGIEVMGSSDNVIRAGLTHKHVDTAELIGILDYSPQPPTILEPVRTSTREAVYEAPVDDFRLACIDADTDEAIELDQWGPDLVMCVAGRATATGADGSGLTLDRGTAAFVPASTGGYRIEAAAENCRIARLTVGTVSRPSRT